MPAVSSFIAVAAIGGKVLSGRKAKKASKRANAAQRAINKLKNKQAKRAFLRKFRQFQAAALVGGVASGVSVESSGVQGTLAGQATQAATGIAEFNQFDKLGGEQTAALNAQASANFQSSVFGSIASFATSAGGGDFLDSLKNPFKKPIPNASD